MSKARTLANFISDNNEFADGTISVSEVSGAAPLASPSFTGTPKSDSSFEVEGSSNAILTLDETSGVAGGAQSTYISMQAAGSQTAYMGVASSGGIMYIANEYGPLNIMTGAGGSEQTRLLMYSSGEAVFNESSVNYDFRVESDNSTHALFVNAGDDKVSINTGSTHGTLTIEHNLNNSSDWWTNAKGVLYLANTNASGMTAIKLNNANDTRASLVFNTSGTGRFQLFDRTSTQERLGITASETIINEDSANVDFRVESDSNANAFFVDGGTSAVGIGNTASSVAHLNIDGNISGGYGGVIRLNNDGTSGCSGFIGVTDTNWSIGSGKLIIGRATQGNGPASAYTEIAISGSEVVFNENSNDRNFRVESNAYSTMFQVDAGNNWVSIGQAVPATGFDGDLIVMGSSASTTTSPVRINRSTDGYLIRFMESNNTEGYISVSGTTVSYNGFAGRHESSGIPTTTARGTVVSTIDELDVYLAGPKQGQARTDHAKVEVSNTVGDPCVYGVVDDYTETGAVNVVSVGIGAVLVTGSCAKGDLLESNGDGTAKVQSDDIVRSKTLGKVTIGNSDAGVKLVPCVMYCG